MEYRELRKQIEELAKRMGPVGTTAEYAANLFEIVDAVTSELADINYHEEKVALRRVLDNLERG